MTFVLGNILQPIIDVFEQVLLFFHDTIGVGWGLSIILLTVTVRTVLLPLTLKQFKGMQAMQQLAPEMKRLQEKYKDDKQRVNQEMMKLYQEHQVNPFASCLPLVAQLPVFISLFYMLRKDLKEDICGEALTAAGKTGSQLVNTSCGDVGQGEHFLFIPDITAHATGGVLVALIAMYVLSQLGSSLLMSSTIQDPTQRKIMLALPFFFVIFVINFPAGLLVYWITTNLWTVSQQYFIRRSAGLPVPGRPGNKEDVASPVSALAGAAGLVSHADEGKDTAKKVSTRKPEPKGKPASGKGVGNGKPAADKGGATNGSAANGSGANGDRKPPPSPRSKKKKRTGKRR